MCVLFLWIYLFSSDQILVDGAQLTTLKRLNDDLLKNYDRNFRPVLDFSTTMKINVTLAFISASIEENSNFEAWIRLSLNIKFDYIDELLTWNPDDYEGLKKIFMPADKIWTPSLHLSFKDLIVKDHGRNEFRVLTRSNGTTSYRKQTVHMFKCSTSYENWPRDTLTCLFTVFSPMNTKYLDYNYMTPRKEANLNTNINRGGYLDALNGWVLLPVSTKRVEELTTDETGAVFLHRSIQTVFTFSRLNQTFYHLLFVPSIVYSVILWLSFLVKSPTQRIVLVCVSLIGQIQMLAYNGHIIPSNGDREVFIVNYYRDTLVLSFLGLVVTVISIKLLTLEAEFPKYLSTVLKHKVVEILLYQGDIKFGVFADEDAEDGADLTDFRAKDKSQWRRTNLLLSRITLALLLFLHCVTFIVSFPRLS